MRLAWIVIALTACEKSPPAPPVPTPAPASPAPAPAPDAEPEPAPVDAGHPDAAPAPATPVNVAESFTLTKGRSHAAATGGTWRLTSVGHKRPVRGGSSKAMYELDVTKDGVHREVYAETHSDSLYSEGVVFGQLYVITSASYGDLRIQLYANAPKPLSEDAAVALAERKAKAKGLPDGDGRGYSVEGGTLRIRVSEKNVAQWHAVIGMYSRRVITLAAGEPSQRQRSDRGQPEQ